MYLVVSAAYNLMLFKNHFPFVDFVYDNEECSLVKNIQLCRRGLF